MVHVIQPDPEVPPGLAAVELDHLPIGWRLVRLDKGEPLPEVQEDDAVILLGGRMSANDEAAFPFLGQLKLFVRESVRRDRRFLGICLGAQLLAAAFGAIVVEKRWGERGNCDVQLNPAGCDDVLFAGIQPRFPTFQWHDDSFDLPEGAECLALSERCPHQAFRIGTRGWGLQFHPEVTPEIIDAWSSEKDGSNTKHLIDGWRQKEAEYRQVMRNVLRNFLT